MVSNAYRWYIVRSSVVLSRGTVVVGRTIYSDACTFIVIDLVDGDTQDDGSVRPGQPAQWVLVWAQAWAW